MGDITEQGGTHISGAQAWGQALAAVVVMGALGAGLWAQNEMAGTNAGTSEPRPATCSDGETEPPKGKHLSGVELCEALNRSDLGALLGTPTETAKTASGSDSAFGKIATPSSQVEFETYTVTLAATYDGRPVAGSAASLGAEARQRTMLGRPAVLYSDRTISIRFRLDGSDSESGPGVPARALTVARDAKDSGGSLDVTLWRADGMVPDDAVLLRVAEKVLPTVRGWAPAE
ncbi:DUF6215 domain-containing protein [Streptomyces sp. NPDC057099]|uniref:DUF6215 domain-containing protein n=1 Tax=Streptomyces sp. NPDC057099 TaxID=3346019 RepID=UPI00363E3298